MATSTRPSWQGHLRLSLVSCPVVMMPATQDARTSLHRLSKQTHNRLRQQTYDPETGDVVDRRDAILGWEFSKGEYVLVDPEEKEALLIESSKTMDVETFVDRDEIDTMFWGVPYYLKPADTFAQEAFAVIREAMVEQGKVGLARVTIGGRERPVAIEPYGKGMRVTQLRAAAEVRNAADFFGKIEDVALNEELLKTAGAIIEQKRDEFAPAMFTDRYQDALRALVEAKVKGGKPVTPKVTEPQDTKVVDLFAKLRESLEASTLDAKSSARRPATKRPAAKSAAKSPAKATPKRKSA